MTAVLRVRLHLHSRTQPIFPSFAHEGTATPKQASSPWPCSCESFRKRALTSDADGNISSAIIHSVASVFCPPALRGQGYAPRMTRELAKVLRTWQSENHRCIGSILYSDIGKEYHTKLGWRPNLTNSHIEFQPSTIRHRFSAQVIPSQDLAELCHRDEVMIRKAVAVPEGGVRHE